MTAPIAKKAASTVAKKHTAKKAGSKSVRTHQGKHRAPSKGITPDDAKRVAKKTADVTKKPFDNKYAPRLKPLKSVVTYRHALAAEFYIGLLIIILNRVKGNSNKAQPAVIQLAAFVATWIVLFSITAGGQKAARVSAWLGALIVMTLAFRKWQSGQLPPDEWPQLIENELQGKGVNPGKQPKKGQIGYSPIPGNTTLPNGGTIIGTGA